MIITLYVDTAPGYVPEFCNGWSRPALAVEPEATRWRVDIDTSKLEATVRPATVEEHGAFPVLTQDEVRKACERAGVEV